MAEDELLLLSFDKVTVLCLPNTSKEAIDRYYESTTGKVSLEVRRSRLHSTLFRNTHLLSGHQAVRIP